MQKCEHKEEEKEKKEKNILSVKMYIELMMKTIPLNNSVGKLKIELRIFLKGVKN